MALRGNLRDFSLPDVFQLVTFSKKTGVLRIKREDGAEGSVWFRDGEVFFAASNWHTEPLGERLVKAQRVTPQALSKALSIRAAEGEGGRRLGQILIDESYITDKVLETFVQDQIQDTIFDLMRWDEGEFDFEQMPEAVEEDIGLSVSIENIVMEGSRRLEEWNRIKKKIPSMDVVFKMATAPGEGSFEISLKPIEWNLLLLTDGTRTVAELAHETSRTDFEVARIVYGLFSAGLLEFAAEDEVERLRAERAEREAARAAIEGARAAAAAERPAVPDTVRAVTVEPSATEVGELAEEPEFLGGASVAPTAEDLSVFEEMMGAVLEVPGSVLAAETPASATEPRVEQELPFVGVSQPEPGAPGAFEFDLTGLTQELLQPEPPAETVGADIPELPVLEVEAELAPGPELAPEPELELPSFVAEAGDQAAGAEPPGPQPIEMSEATELGLPVFEPMSPAEGSGAPEADLAALLSYDNLQDIELQPIGDTAAPAGAGFETDLMSLGLGEVPPELLAPPSLEQLTPVPGVAEPEEPAPAEFIESYESVQLAEQPAPAGFDIADLEAAGPEFGLEVVASMGADFVEPAPEPTGEPGPDFSALMESLDAMEAPAESAEPTAPVAGEEGFDADLLAELAAEVPARPDEVEGAGGVISTDAFLEDIQADGLGLSGGLGDELSALTGMDRPKGSRPTASVNKIPENSAGVLHRDQRVDKDTVLKIIDGIKNL